MLSDGRVVHVRPMAPCDRDGLAWEVDHADDETLHLRFFSRAIRTRPEFVDGLVDLDYHERLALVAIGEAGEGAGVGRYAVTSEPHEAQAAVVVHPRWRRVGLGRLLLERIEAAALARGITRMTAVYLAENVAVDRLRSSEGIDPPVFHDEVAEVTWTIPRSRD